MDKTKYNLHNLSVIKGRLQYSKKRRKNRKHMYVRQFVYLFDDFMTAFNVRQMEKFHKRWLIKHMVLICHLYSQRLSFKAISTYF